MAEAPRWSQWSSLPLLREPVRWSVTTRVRDAESVTVTVSETPHLLARAIGESDGTSVNQQPTQFVVFKAAYMVLDLVEAPQLSLFVTEKKNLPNDLRRSLRTPKFARFVTISNERMIPSVQVIEMARHAEKYTAKWGSEMAAAGEHRTNQDVPVVEAEHHPQAAASTSRENAGQAVWRERPPNPPSETPPSFASAMSFVGCTRRISAWAGRHGGRGNAYQVALWAGVVLILLLMYVLILGWYSFLLAATLLFLVVPLFWPFVPAMFSFFGFRSHRRSQRKAQYMSEQQLAVMKHIAGGRSNPPDGGRR